MLAYALELQILTGARRGEIPPLRRSDVHDSHIEFKREQLSVRSHGNVPEHCEIVEHTKTHTDRYYPRTEAINEFLRRLTASLNEFYPDSEYLFPADTKTGVIGNSAVYSFYRRICKKLGIKISKDEIKGTHSFRRNAITDTVNLSGGDVILASKLYGNSPEVIMQNYYTGIDQTKALSILNQRHIS